MEVVELSSICTDAGTQIRAKIRQDVVREYAEAMQAGTNFPALNLINDGERLYLIDGFHRKLAAHIAGITHFPCRIAQGTLRDALIAATSQNLTHGLQRSNADKRRAIEIALKLFPNHSANAIAQHCGVSDKTVTSVIAAIRNQEDEQKQELKRISEIRSRSETRLIGQDGKQRPAIRPRKETPQQKLDREHLKRIRDAFELIASIPFDGTEAYERFGILNFGDKVETALDWIAEFRGAMESEHLIPLRTHGYFAVGSDEVRSWVKAFPFIDVDAELRKCAAWNQSNPDKRKTKRGVRKHVNWWLDMANEKMRKEVQGTRRLSAVERVELATGGKAF